MVPDDVALGSFDLSDPEFWLSSREHREGAFATLRREQPISWHDEWEFVGTPFPKGPGYWSLVNHEDVWQVSRNPQIFASGQGVNIGDMPIEIAEFFGSMIAMGRRTRVPAEQLHQRCQAHAVRLVVSPPFANWSGRRRANARRRSGGAMKRYAHRSYASSKAA